MAVALSANAGWPVSLKPEANRGGDEELIRGAAEFGRNPVFAVEGTGCYGAFGWRRIDPDQLRLMPAPRRS